MRRVMTALLVSGAFISGCQTNPDNLLFVDSNLLGISVGASAGQGAPLKLGYSNFNYFSVPVVRNDEKTGTPNVLAVDDGTNRTGAFSAIGVFDASSQGCVGKVAAVGLAARKVAEVAAKRC